MNASHIASRYAVDFRGLLRRDYVGNYRDAFEKDVIPIGSEELYRRIILMSYKLLDANANKLTSLLSWGIPDMDKESFSKLEEDAMKEVWGDEAEMRLFAVRYTMYTSDRIYFYYKALPSEYAPYLEAAELTSDKAYRIKLMLCANALEYMLLSEGEDALSKNAFSQKLSDDVQRAVSIIKDIMKSGIEKDNVYLLTALAPASFFDEELKDHFNR